VLIPDGSRLGLGAGVGEPYVCNVFEKEIVVTHAATATLA